LKISTPLILVSTTVSKFIVFDHENSQIKITGKKITKIKKNAYLPTLLSHLLLTVERRVFIDHWLGIVGREIKSEARQSLTATRALDSD
jgi:hypothetical protein